MSSPDQVTAAVAPVASSNAKKIGVVVVIVVILAVLAVVVYYVAIKKPATPGTPATPPVTPGTPATPPVTPGTPATPSATPGTPATPPVTPGLKFHLDAGNPASYSGTGSTWTDLAGSGIVTTLYNSPLYSAAKGGYLAFDNTKSQYGKTSASLPALTKWSIEVWQSYKKRGILQESPSIIAEIYGGDGKGINFVLGAYRVGLTDNVSAAYYDGLTSTWIRTPVAPITEGWHHIVGTYNGTTLNVYMDGALLQTTPSTVVPTSSGMGYHIMDRWGGGKEYWAGYLAVLRIYDRALSLDEIKAGYTSGKSRFL
jgi:hypothetical protein